MERRTFLGWLGAAVGVYAVDPTLTAAQPRPADSLADPNPASVQAQRFVIRNESQVPMVVAFKSTFVERAQRATDSHTRITASRPYQSEGILLPGEELTISAAVMKGLDPRAS